MYLGFLGCYIYLLGGVEESVPEALFTEEEVDKKKKQKKVSKMIKKISGKIINNHTTDHIPKIPRILVIISLLLYNLYYIIIHLLSQ